jgi:hypothetical protein
MLLADLSRENQRNGAREPGSSRQAHRPGKYEWWHFDHIVHHGKTWIDLGGEIGYSPEALSAPKKGDKPFWNGGVGYTTDKANNDKFGPLDCDREGNLVPLGNGETSTVASPTATSEAAEEGSAGEQAAEETSE